MGGGVALVLAVVVVLVLVLGGSKDAADARSVADVADVAVAAAEDLDVEKGIDLLCAAPSSDERDELEQLIADGKERAGTERPAVDYAISNVADGAEGSFTVTISSDEQGLADSEVSFEVVVATDGDRSCIDALATQDAPIEAG